MEQLKPEIYKSQKIYFTKYVSKSGNVVLVSATTNGMFGSETGRTKKEVLKNVKYRIDNFIQY